MNESEAQPVKGAPERPLRIAIDPHGERARPMADGHRGGTRDDRMLREVTVASP